MVFKGKDATRDLGIVLIGFAIYSFIFEPWSDRVSFLASGATEFGAVKALLIVGVVFATAKYTQLCSRIGALSHRSNRAIGRAAFLALGLEYGTSGLVWYLIGFREALIFFIGCWLVGSSTERNNFFREIFGEIKREADRRDPE